MAAAKLLRIPLLLIISIALSLPAQAQNAPFDDKDGGGGYASAVNTISLTPEASPAAAPSSSDEPAPGGSYDPSVDAQPASGDSSADSSSSSTAGDDSSSANSSTTATLPLKAIPWRKSDNLDNEPIMSYDVPKDKQKSVNMFVQSTMQVTEAKTQNFIDTVIEKRLNDPQIGTFTKDCLRTCKEVYEDSKDAMKKTLEDVDGGNYYKANIDVSAISSDAETCKECVKMVYGKDQELDKFNTWVDGVIDQCLTMITGYKA
ncbi:PREDICTED: uncharacterized protein LOC109150544 isoform X2 [Ipomoea nil]|uniref:uncharacterized protein LOC109150544 isoform X1 n=1 Tax=Ipomoea nil TaxID=35883 RepID=UPI000901699F|nr:PREDICTED: uncharacterized protein LOC109150544 isoform X1 [Ipomoea nil]XP_019154032.1 PREDICTED: uncharacterized protein LOC109150544 isoform X2 [Ipomoea nil]